MCPCGCGLVQTTHSSKVAVALDGHSQLSVVAGLTVNDGTELGDEILEDGVTRVMILTSSLYHHHRDLRGRGS